LACRGFELIKKDIILLHKSIYTHIKKKALSYEGRPSRELARYLEDYKYYADREYYQSSEDEIFESLSNSNFIYLGDFHTFDQNQRTLYRIMRTLNRSSGKFALGLEMIQSKHQVYIDTYLNGQLTELEFLESVEYSESWRFPWNHYKVIFDFAKDNKIPILCLNSEGKLSNRDKHACELLTKYHHEHPTIPLLVLFGELHILPNKLPKEILLSSKYRVRQLIIHQNIDDVYWKQVENGTNYKILKFNHNEFCIQTSPPWVKYESMVYWYESLMDDPEFDIHEYIIENGLKIFGSNANDNFVLISNEMIKSLDLEIKSDDLEDFNLYDHTSLERVEDLIQELPLKKLIVFYNHFVEKNQSFKIPGALSYYCSNYSINKISYLAGIHLFNIYLNKTGNSQLEILKARSLQNKLIYFIFEHMYAYFFSKIFNPHRKCDLYIDLKLRLAAPKVSKKESELLIDSIDIIDEKKSLDQIARKSNLNRMNDIGKVVGQFLGDYFYDAITSKRQITNRDILEEDYLKVNVNIETFNRLKSFFLSDLSYKIQKKRFF
jgi:hypothetical protein